MTFSKNKDMEPVLVVFDTGSGSTLVNLLFAQNLFFRKIIKQENIYLTDVPHEWSGLSLDSLNNRLFCGSWIAGTGYVVSETSTLLPWHFQGLVLKDMAAGIIFGNSAMREP